MLTARNILAALESDQSSWADIRHYPDTVTCRRIVRLADFAAADRKRWATVRLAFECPELSTREIAAITGRTITEVYRHLMPVDLDNGGDLMIPEPFFEVRNSRKGNEVCTQSSVVPDCDARAERGAADRTGSPEAGGRPFGKTYRRTRALCGFAAAHPGRWRTLRLFCDFPELTIETLAVRLSVSERTVRYHLAPIRLDPNVGFGITDAPLSQSDAVPDERKTKPGLHINGGSEPPQDEEEE